jgi:hypothetical protein
MFDLRQTREHRSSAAEEFGKTTYSIKIDVPQEHPLRIGCLRCDAAKANADILPHAFADLEPRTDYIR